MKLNRRTTVLSLTGIIIFIATILIYVISGRSLFFLHSWIGFIFLLISEIIFFAGLIGIEYLSKTREQIIIRAGGGTVIVIYSLLAFALSFVFMRMPFWSINKFLSVQILMFAVAFVLVLVFIYTSKSVSLDSVQILSAQAKIKEMEDRLKLLAAEKVYGKQIGELAEGLRFSDVTAVVEADTQIEEDIKELELELSKEEYDGKKIEELIQGISMSIKERKIQVRNRKPGRI